MCTHFMNLTIQPSIEPEEYTGVVSGVFTKIEKVKRAHEYSKKLQFLLTAVSHLFVQFQLVYLCFLEVANRSFYTHLRVLIVLLLTTSVISVMASKEEFSEKGNEFAVDFYSKVIKNKKDENVIISPFSVRTCLALAYAGAGGTTAEEIANGLRLISHDRKVVAESFKQILDIYANSPILKIANKVYIKDGYKLKDEFNEIATKNFYSEAENLDFSKNVASAQTINNWVETKTNNKIKDLIGSDDLDGDTRAVLVNAIYFKGMWEHQFPLKATKKEDFWINETSSVQVDMMNVKDHFLYGFYDHLDATGLEMRYKDSNLSMFILLPNSKTGLELLEEKIATMQLSTLTKSMREREVIVKLPRFKIEFSADLNEPLKDMGIKEMFNSADLSNLLTSPELLKVSKVVHKAVIEVNEEGTEAAAATAIKKRTKRDCSDALYFKAEHPFVFFILYENLCIFTGSFRTTPIKSSPEDFHDEM